MSVRLLQLREWPEKCNVGGYFHRMTGKAG